jgi:hypothetical protein
MASLHEAEATTTAREPIGYQSAPDEGRIGDSDSETADDVLLVSRTERCTDNHG